MSSYENLSFEDFKLWKARELRVFLRDGGLKITGAKEELVALAYAACQLSVPLKPSAAEEHKVKQEQYSALLNIGGKTIPDPLTELTAKWIGEKDGICNWPPIFHLQIAEFLLTVEQSSTGLNKRLLSDYKDGKAYSYFDSKWLKEVFYHEINPTSFHCILKSKSTPSQKVNNIPHDIWLCVEKKTGTVASAYCSCFAG